MFQNVKRLLLHTVPTDEALVAAELATAFPSNAGYVTWVTATRPKRPAWALSGMAAEKIVVASPRPCLCFHMRLHIQNRKALKVLRFVRYAFVWLGLLRLRLHLAPFGVF